MSRCYPYPPPGYSPNTATNYALIQSIKLQKDKERVKLERKKQKKREKKERKRKKKETAKEQSSSRWISGGDNRQLKTSYSQKNIEDEFVERLENSSLSEEHGQPVCSQNPSCSSDSTQNSNKRKRSTLPSNGIHGDGTVVHVRLSSHEHGQCDTSKREDRSKDSVKHDAERASSPLLKKNKKQLLPFMSVSGQPIAKDKTTASCSKLHENDIELEFKNLILSYVPPSFHHEFVDDQDWLFRRKHKCIRMKEKGEVSNDMSCGTSALLPRAQYLDDAELYAFPFTVPF